MRRPLFASLLVTVTVVSGAAQEGAAPPGAAETKLDKELDKIINGPPPNPAEQSKAHPFAPPSPLDRSTPDPPEQGARQGADPNPSDALPLPQPEDESFAWVPYVVLLLAVAGVVALYLTRNRDTGIGAAPPAR